MSRKYLTEAYDIIHASTSNETEDGNDVTRAISYDLYNGQTGYQKDIDFDAVETKQEIRQ